MKILLFSGVTLFFLLLDLLLGDWGIFAGFSCYISLCFAMSYGLPWGITAAFFAGFMIDAVYLREFSFTAASYLLAFAVVFSLLRRSRELPLLLISGGAAGVMISLGAVCQSRWFGSELPGPDISTLLCFSLGFGALFFPLLIWVFDFFSFRVHLPLCSGRPGTEARKRRRSISRSALKGGKL